jgi:hypothetical protein
MSPTPQPTVSCGVAILVAPPTAQAEPQIQFLLNDVAQLARPLTGTNGVVTASGIKVGTFTVSLNGSSNSGSQGSQGILQLTATVTGGGPLDVLIIVLTDTAYTQAGNAIFAESVQGTITGPASFLAFSDSHNLR